MSDGAQLQAKGIREFQRGDYEKATATFEEAITAYEKEKNPVSVAEMKVNLGLCHRETDALEKAIALMEEGLAIFREHEDKHREAQVLGNLALAYSRQENDEQATTLYREAAALFREAGDDDNYGETVLALADLQFKSGNLVQAVGTFEAGLEHIRNPNQRQKMAKQLLVVKNRMLGQKKIKESSGDDEEPTSDRRRRRSLRRKKND